MRIDLQEDLGIKEKQMISKKQTMHHTLIS